MKMIEINDHVQNSNRKIQEMRKNKKFDLQVEKNII